MLAANFSWAEFKKDSRYRSPGKQKESRWTLTICMENPENSERIQMEQFVPVEIFRKKSNIPSRYLYLFSVLKETTEIFCIIRLDYHGQGSSWEKVKNLPAFC